MKQAFNYGERVIEPAVKRVNAIKQIAVIGAGTMGQGIVIDLLLKTNAVVVVIDIEQTSLDRARENISARWLNDVESLRLRSEDAESMEQRTVYTTDYASLEGSSVIWEAATESLDVKEKIFSTIEETVAADTVDAVFSNTSSHTTEELAVLFESESFRSKLLTVHGYFPFEANRLIDVMKGKYASRRTFDFGIVFADQILEKTVIALPRDHHGYITDPIFQGMGAIVSWDVERGDDIVVCGAVWDLLTANPFSVLDRTGHMPYTESSRHLGAALPAHDRLRSLYCRDGKAIPDWIAELESRGCGGINSKEGTGFFSWSDGGSSRPERVFDPSSGTYVDICEVSRDEYWSWYEAAERDRRAGKIKSADSLVLVANADDLGGRAFRRYVLPIALYALDLIQDGYATPGQVNICTRAGLRFKVGIIEMIDALTEEFTIDGLLQLIRRAADENRDDPYVVEMLDTDGLKGPRTGRPCLLHEMKKRNIDRLLGYGSAYRTPVAELDLESGDYRASYPDLKLIPPNSKDRVASIVFNCPMRGNVLNRAVVDQLGHAYHRVLELHRDGRCGAVMFCAAGTGMRMLGADAREFNRGWFDRNRGYAPLSESEAAASSRNAVALFRLIQRSPLATMAVFGEKWGGGAEFTYFCDLRFDVRQYAFVYDALDRTSRWGPMNTYNQPELDYAILPGFGGVGELQRLGLGDSAIFELFDCGMTADRAYQVGLSNGVFDEEIDALRRGYERARQMAKDGPYSRALFKKELTRGIDDEALARETGETFNPARNPFIRSGLVKLLDRGGRSPKMDYSCIGTKLPGWTYPEDEPQTTSRESDA